MLVLAFVIPEAPRVVTGDVPDVSVELPVKKPSDNPISRIPDLAEALEGVMLIELNTIADELVLVTPRI